MDVWKEFDNNTNTCVMQVKKSQKKNFKTFCKSNNIHYSERIRDVKVAIDRNIRSLNKRRDKFDYTKYNRYNAVIIFLFTFIYKILIGKFIVCHQIIV